MGCAGSQQIKHAKQVTATKVQVNTSKSVKELESLHLDPDLISKPGRSVVNLEYRANGTSIYQTLDLPELSTDNWKFKFDDYDIHAPPSTPALTPGTVKLYSWQDTPETLTRESSIGYDQRGDVVCSPRSISSLYGSPNINDDHRNNYAVSMRRTENHYQLRSRLNSFDITIQMNEYESSL